MSTNIWLLPVFWNTFLLASITHFPGGYPICPGCFRPLKGSSSSICPFIVTVPSMAFFVFFSLYICPNRSHSHSWLQLLPVSCSWCSKKREREEQDTGPYIYLLDDCLPWLSLRDLKFKNSCFMHCLYWQWHFDLSSHPMLKTQELTSRLFLIPPPNPCQNNQQIPSSLCHFLLQLL